MFEREQRVLFRHCDPAGMVFYPRYFEMVNDLVEAFFADIGLSFEEMHPENGVPTVCLETRFTAPSRHGEVLRFALRPTKVGRTSLEIEVSASAGEEMRLTMQSTLVFVDAERRPTAWPSAFKAILESKLSEDA